MLAALDHDGPETCIAAIRAAELDDRMSWADDASALLIGL